MEEYFQQKCVTSDAAPEPVAAIPTWTTAHRCECVMLQENAHASGASRAILASILRMTAASNKTQNVVLVAVELPLVQQSITASEKLIVLDFWSDWLCLEAALSENPAESPLLSKIQTQLEAALAKSSSSSLSPPSARPNVVVVDSLNVLLEIYPLAKVLQWLRSVRRDPRVGSVVFRLNVAALSDASTAQTLALETTAVVQVETHASLRAYPILAKERRREIPKRMHGLVLLLRKKKNGRTSESVEYFHAANGQLIYSSSSDDTAVLPSTQPSQPEKKPVALKPASTTPAPSSTTAFTSSGSSASVSATTGSGRALPVGVDDVSFNLSISAEEEAAKRNVQLPYMHQGGSNASANNLLFIDDDDPDWDDDDLDDDLDI